MSILNNAQNNLNTEITLPNRETAEILNSLVAKSQTTLEAILNDPQVPSLEKAEIALKILQIATANNYELGEKIKKPDLQSLPLTVVNSEKEKIAELPLPESPIKKSPTKQSDRAIETKFFPANCWQIDNFLPPEKYEKVLNTALGKRSHFKNSQTVTNTNNYRQSSVLPGKQFSEVYFLVKNIILETLPSVLNSLSHPEFFVSHIEMQMTAHNNGCFYKVHTDAGSAKTKTRELTYVYYFYQEPKNFSGGELKLYDTEQQGKKFIQKENSKIIEPRNNSIVFFNSRCKHEVLPISCASGKFEDSRFTLNGWLRR